MRVPALLSATLIALVGLPAAETTLVVEHPQTAGMSMFRVHWDQPTPLAEDGATTWWDQMKDEKTKAYPAHGAYAVWTSAARAGKPGALAFDALNRSLLLRFPEAADAIAAQAAAGRALLKAQVVLPWLDDELLPPGATDWGWRDNYEFNTGWGTLELWKQRAPRWHAVAWALRRPWAADEERGPTFNAAINGAVYWSGYGASDERSDRFPARLGPVEVSGSATGSALDVTPLLTDAAYGADAGERVRRFADCGLLVRKQETYDHAFFTGVYEWSTATGGRAIRIRTPRLVLTFTDAVKPPALVLPPAADVGALAAAKVSAPEGHATAVLPSEEELKAYEARVTATPPWMGAAQAAHLRELFALRSSRQPGEALWTIFLPNHWVDQLRGGEWQEGRKVGMHPATYRDSFGAWVDMLINRPSRGWSGFEIGDQVTQWQLAEPIMPGPAKDAVRRYWIDWMMPGRSTAPQSRIRDEKLHDGRLVHPMADQLAAQQGTAKPVDHDSYHAATGDWRGNKSFYRSGFCYDQSTQNFNTSAAVGATVFGTLAGSPEGIADGRHGVDAWLLKGWIWNDGSGQEHLDHYYCGITVKGLKALRDAAPDAAMALTGDSLVTKAVDEAIGAWHPNLKRFLAPSSRTSLEYLLGAQDGMQYLMHVLSSTGALTDLEDKLPNGMHAFGDEWSPQLVALMSQRGPWVEPDLAALVDHKPLPWQATHSHMGQWRRCYLGTHFGLASSQTLGGRIQAMAQWRREDAPVTTARQLGTLDCRLGVNDTRWANDAPGWIGSPGKQVIAQDRNRWLVLGSPAGDLSDGGKRAITSVQQSLGLFDIREGGPTWELWVDDHRVDLATLPLSLKPGAHVIVRDGVTWIGTIPLPGREAGLRVGSEQTFDYHGKVTYQARLQLDSYAVRQAQPLAKDADWYALDRAWAGFALELGDASGGSFEAFRARFAQQAARASYDEATRRLTAGVGSGAEALQVVAETAPAKQADGGWNRDHGLELVASTLGGKPLYPDYNGVLRDTPVEQFAWDRAEKDGIVLRGHKPTGEGARLFLQSFAGGQRLTAWNPQGSPTDLVLELPGGGVVRSDGIVGLVKLHLDRQAGTLEIAHQRTDRTRQSDPRSQASAFLIKDAAIRTVTVNGVATPPVAAVIGDVAWRAVPLDPALPLRDAAAMGAILATLDQPVVAAAAAQNFMHWDLAGPFANDDAAHGPELAPTAPFDAQQVWVGASNEGGDVAWKSYGLAGHTQPFTLGRDFNQHDQMVTTFPSTVFQTKGKPCTYYMHAVLRADVAQEIGINLRTGSREGAARRIDAWAGTRRVPVLAASTGANEVATIVRLPLVAGENHVYLRLSQNPQGVSWENVRTTFGEPIFTRPTLTGVEVRSADGTWLAACPREAAGP